MPAFNLNQIIDKIDEKTNSGEVIWIPYNVMDDTNPYSLKYFSTISELRNGEGYVTKFQSGHIFLIPGIDGQYYLFVQANPSCLPAALNYGSSYLAYSSRLESLYHKISDSFNPVDTFLRQLLN